MVQIVDCDLNTVEVTETVQQCLPEGVHGSVPGTPTLICIVGRISVLQNEKYPLFTEFWPEN